VELDFQNNWYAVFMIVFGYSPFFSGCITCQFNDSVFTNIQGKLFVGNVDATKFYYKDKRLVIYQGTKNSQIHMIARVPGNCVVSTQESYDLTGFTEISLA
jgi:hypothetical protein